MPATWPHPAGEHLQPALPVLIGIISAGLRDAERVRDAALKAVEPLMVLVNSEADITQFHGLVVNLVEVRAWRAQAVVARTCV